MMINLISLVSGKLDKTEVSIKIGANTKNNKDNKPNVIYKA
jgi:hypothetical protein